MADANLLRVMRVWRMKDRIFPMNSGKRGEMSLYCLPSAGGSASMYSSWSRSSWLEVCPVEYPGHGARNSEPLSDDPDEITVQILDAILERDGPFALFGHSMGAALIWRLVSELRRRQLLGRLSLIALSGRPETSMLPDRGARHLLPREEFMLEVERYSGLPSELCESEEFMDFFLPILRNDFHLAYKMRSDPPQNVDTPLIAFSGREDPDIGPGSMEAWRDYSSRWIGHYSFDGHHFYLSEPTVRDQILRLIEGYVGSKF